MKHFFITIELPEDLTKRDSPYVTHYFCGFTKEGDDKLKRGIAYNVWDMDKNKAVIISEPGLLNTIKLLNTEGLNTVEATTDEVYGLAKKRSKKK